MVPFPPVLHPKDHSPLHYPIFAPSPKELLGRVQRPTGYIQDIIGTLLPAFHKGCPLLALHTLMEGLEVLHLLFSSLTILVQPPFPLLALPILMVGLGVAPHKIPPLLTILV